MWGKVAAFRKRRPRSDNTLWFFPLLKDENSVSLVRRAIVRELEADLESPEVRRVLSVARTVLAMDRVDLCAAICWGLATARLRPTWKR